MNRQLRRALVPLSCVTLFMGGCATLGSNVSGSFRCNAPDGTCAPSTMIDDAALASMAKEASSTDLLAPAGPYQVDDGDASSLLKASVKPARIASAQQATGVPGSGRVLRVVFPAYVDRYGRLHERKAVQAVVERDFAAVAASDLKAGRAGSSETGLLGVAEAAPSAVAQVVADLPKGDGGLSVGQVANAGALSPVEAIKAEVASKLAKPRNQPSSFSGLQE